MTTREKHDGGGASAEPSYGEAAARLDEILRTIEDGEVDIDHLSGLVREAAELVQLCRKKIQAAEIQVKTIAEQLEREEEERAGEPLAGEAAGEEDDAFPEDIRY